MSNPILPKGYHPNDWGDWGVYYPPPEEKPLTKRCTCGTNIGMGYEVPEEFHQDYCDLKEKNDNGKTS